jgi:hypothetical protein
MNVFSYFVGGSGAKSESLDRSTASGIEQA